MSENIKKSSKVEASEVKMKPLTKAELMVKFKALEERSDKLAEENKARRKPNFESESYKFREQQTADCKGNYRE